jgi:hypothetical protein
MPHVVSEVQITIEQSLMEHFGNDVRQIREGVFERHVAFFLCWP